jgi:two-component system LytT family response regulator
MEDSTTQKSSVLIVDDERLARDRIRELLGNIDDVECAGEAADGLEAIEKIEKLRPDIVLLDIQMRGLNGVDVVQGLDPQRIPHIVFVTAHDKYAIQAFELNAVDYLLKPVAEDRLRSAIQKCKKLIGTSVHRRIEEIQAALMQGRPAYLQRLIGRKGQHFHVIPTRDICCVYIEHKMVHLVTLTDSYWTTYSLKYLEPNLNPNTFQRLNRCYIVNLQYVKEFSPAGHGAYTALLANGREIVVSRQYAPILKRHVGWK